MAAPAAQVPIAMTLSPATSVSLDLKSVLVVLGLVIAGVFSGALWVNSTVANKADVSEIKADLRDIKTKQSDDEARAARATGQLEALQGTVADVKSDVKELRSDLRAPKGR
jgi:hypothetical protein